MTAGHLATCYGSDIESLADLAGDLDVLSPEDAAGWNLREWLFVADTLGFRRELDAAVQPLRRARLGLLTLHPTALAAFERWHEKHASAVSTALSPVARSQRARVRHEVLLGAAASTDSRHRLWYVDRPATELVHLACFERGEAPISGRAFLVDASENYFHAHRPASAPQTRCSWETPVLLSLGTFPWVYGGRLQAHAPALAWDRSTPWNPAAVGMRLCAGFWQPAGNLAQDARQVVTHYRRFRTAVDFALEDANDPAVRRRGVLLDAPGSHSVAGLNSALGYLSVQTHNYIVRRFSAFFALRRSLAKSAGRLAPELQTAIADNPDPCLRRLALKPPTKIAS